MEKEALIDIILNDIKEVHALVNTFKGKNEINAAFINLTRTKIGNISEELSLLEQLNDEKPVNSPNESSLTSEALSTSAENNGAAIAESSSRFAEGESYRDSNVVGTTSKDTSIASSADDPSSASSGAAKVADTNATTTPTASTSTEGEAVKNDTQTMDTSIETKASDTETMSDVTETMSDDDKTLKSDSQTMNTSVQTKASDMETMKGDDNAKPSDVQAKPSIKVQTASSSSKQPKHSAKATVLGEIIRKEGASVNEAIANRQEQAEDIKQIGKPVSDVRKAFGLNDRFYYQRELFDNNADLFNQTLDQINQMASYDSAISFLQSNYNWETDNEASEAFYKSIRRRFI